MLTKAQHILQQYFGYSSFRPGQETMIKHALNGHHALAIMPTGGGKSLCYQIPGLVKEGCALIISPLISLMKDQVDALHAHDIPATFINSSISQAEQQKRLAQLQAGAYRFLYVAPERFESPEFMRTIQSIPLSLIAFDEAHCISQWGHDFRPSYRSIIPNLKRLPNLPVTLALTATATDEVIEDIQSILQIKVEHTVNTGYARENLHFHVVKGVDKKEFLLDFIKSRPKESGIIYTPTRKITDLIYQLLSEQGFQTAHYHAGMSESERQLAQHRFIEDEATIMVATNAFGMGIDKSNVRYVIHYALPMNMEAYYQEAGRAGRDGEPSDCYLLFAAQDIQLQRFLIEQSLLEPDKKEREYEKLQAMAHYGHTHRCLPRYILDYFGDLAGEESCGRCSNCSEEGKQEDRTREAQMILSCVKRMGERFGAQLTAKVLNGSKSQKVLELGFNKLTTYGLLSDYTEKDIMNWIHYLMADGYLSIQDPKFPTLQLTPLAYEVLKGNQTVSMRMSIEQKKNQVDVHEGLFDTLRHLRKQLAESKKLPPYVIFSDTSLKDMCRMIPETQQEMLQIKGMGEKKFEQYGTLFLQAIHQYIQDHGPIERQRPSVQTSSNKESKNMADQKPSYLVSYEAFQGGRTLSEIAEDRSLTVTTIENHLFQAYKEGHSIDWTSFFDGETEKLILQKHEVLAEKKLKPLKECLPDEMTYSTIKAVLIKHALM